MRVLSERVAGFWRYGGGVCYFLRFPQITDIRQSHPSDPQAVPL